MSSITQIQIYGERNSGTNFLHKLLELNIKDVEVSYRLGWKHGFINHQKIKEAETPHILFLGIFKDPYSWVLSMYGKPHHAPQLYNIPFADFIRSEWACYSGENYDKRDLIADPIKPEEEMMHERNPKTGERFENVMQLRTAKAKSMLRLQDSAEHFDFYKYEDLLYTPKRLIKMIARKHQLNLINGEEGEIMLHNGYFGKNPKLPFKRKRYYLNKEYFNQYNESDFNHVNQFLDKETEEKLGYQLFESIPLVEQ